MSDEVPEWAIKKAQELLADPEFQKEMEEVEASFERGEGVLYQVVDGEMVRVEGEAD